MCDIKRIAASHAGRSASADNLANLLATLQHGLASNEHAAFVAQLTDQLSQAEQ